MCEAVKVDRMSGIRYDSASFYAKHRSSITLSQPASPDGGIGRRTRFRS